MQGGKKPAAAVKSEEVEKKKSCWQRFKDKVFPPLEI
jgi:hypothetical protein